MKSAKKIMKVLGRYHFYLILNLVFAAISVILQLYIPIRFGHAIDQMLGKGAVRFGGIAHDCFIILICMLFSGGSAWLMNLVNNKLSFSTVRDLRKQAIRSIQNLPVSYLDAHSTGDLVQRVIADADQISDGLLLGFTQLFSGLVTIGATIFFMFSKNVEISLLVILLTPISFLIARFISKHTYQMFRAQTTTRGKQTAFINEMINGQKVVKAFGHAPISSAEFSTLNEELRKYSEKAIFFSSLTNPSTRAVNNIVYAIVALIGSFHIFSGHLSVGGLAVLLAYASQYMKPFNDISSVVTELQNSFACADRIFELIEAKPQAPDPDQSIDYQSGEVGFDDVSFSYIPNRPLIEDFSFVAKPGQNIAIVGPTGCGKTTLINLLMRFYEINGGQIRLDDQNIQSVSRNSLRSCYGMVLQETWLRSGTIRENICFGKPFASEEEIIRAAKEAHSWEFIRRLPEGLDTVIDDNQLSQGQRQLLCITRIMLSHPPMLILDEATSSIDTRTELLIQQAFQNLMEGRTSFIVAHRLSTIRKADQILVMRDGKIMEIGTHDQLLAQRGFYYELYQSQYAILEEA